MGYKPAIWGTVEVTKTTAKVIGNIIRSATAPLTDPSYHDHLLSAKLWTQAFQTLVKLEFFKCNFNIKILWNFFDSRYGLSEGLSTLFANLVPENCVSTTFK